MAIKYISIVLGTIFEIYCINMFTNIFTKKRNRKVQILSNIYINKYFLYIKIIFT